jgi:hypothetical protein
MPDETRVVDRRKMRLGWLLAALALAGCGDDEAAAPAGTPATTGTAAGTTTTTATADGDRNQPRGEPTQPAETPPGDPRQTPLERRAIETMRDYVEGLNAGDGAAVCALFAPGALDAVELPRQRGDCAASMTASIGYRDPRGLPVWESARLQQVRVSELTGDSATVIATVHTTFADRPETSIEDDVVYLSGGGGRWLIAKPSATLYRAIGVGDIPPSVLTPPNPNG